MKFWGGGEKLHIDTALELRKKNRHVFILCTPNSPLWKRAFYEGIPTFPITVGNLSFLNPFLVCSLLIFFKKHKIDTILFSSSQDCKLGSLVAKLAGIENIVYLRGLATPIKNSMLNRIIFQSFLTHIIANSNETKNQILTKLSKYIAKDKIKTIYHGIDIKKSIVKGEQCILEEISQKGHGVILGNASRLIDQKGLEFLIPIAKILKKKNLDFTLFIAGTGELHSKLQLSIKENNLEKDVILLGFVEDMECFMNSIDIFLFPSLSEGFGYVTVEAMIKSNPVVAFRISCNPELIENDKTGFLIEYPDIEAFAEKIELLIKDRDLRNRMGLAGKKTVHEKFALEDKVAEIATFIEETPTKTKSLLK